MSNPSKGTVSATYIFLKDITNPEDPPKKIFLPKAYPFLLKKAKELFGNRMEVRSFYDENGDKIIPNQFDRVMPGGTLYVSSLDSEKENEQPVALKPTNSPSKDKGRIMSTDSYQQIFGTTMGNRVNNDKLAKDTGSRLRFSRTDKEISDDNSKKPRARFITRSEKMQREQQQKEEKEKRKKEMEEKSNQFDQIRARKANAKKEDSIEPNGSIKSMVNTVRRIPVPNKGRNPSQDDTLVSPSKNKYNFLNDDSQASNNSKKKRNTKYNNMNDDENQYEYELNDDFENDENNQRYDEGSTKHSRKGQFYDSNPMNSRNNNQLMNTSNQNNEFNYNGEDDNLKDNEDQNNVKYYNRSSSEINSNEQQEDANGSDKDLKVLISETVRQEGALSKNIPKALESLPEYSETLTQLPELENQQRSNWYSHEIEIMSKNNILPVDEKAFGVKELTEKARSVITNHRHYSAGGLSHRFNIAVVGPNESGKSTFLRILSEEVLTELITTDEWKKTFIFFIDLTTLMSDTTEYSRFYHSMVEKTICCIESQKPELTPYIPMIKKHFDDLILYRQPPKFPKSFMLDTNTQKIAYELQFLINRYSQLWNDEEMLVEWVTSVVYLPILLSKALGFQQFLYVIDHFDVGDIIIDPSPTKFSESPSCVYLIDIFKFILTQTNFIISCSDQQLFFALLEPNMGEERQVQKVYDYVSMLDIIQDVPYSDQQISVEAIEEKTPLLITAQLCGGVPLYLDLWVRVNKIIDQIESTEEEEEEEEEGNEEKIEILNDQIISTLQKIIKTCFISDGKIGKYEITNFKRKTIQKRKGSK